MIEKTIISILVYLNNAILKLGKNVIYYIIPKLCLL